MASYICIWEAVDFEHGLLPSSLSRGTWQENFLSEQETHLNGDPTRVRKPPLIRGWDGAHDSPNLFNICLSLVITT
jgi:hypothetical protein